MTWIAAKGMTGFAKATVSAFYSHFRRLVGSMINEQDLVIGGPGIIVEVDETKIGKRKYNRGHRVEGIWVVVGIERTESRRVFCIPVPDRSAETLADIIRAHVAPGSVVHTDGWRGYSGIEGTLSLEHRVVNHSLGFVDAETGVHTNFVEGTNFAIKRKVPIRCRVQGEIGGHLSEFIWRRLNEGNLWAAFISALRDIHYELD